MKQKLCVLLAVLMLVLWVAPGVHAETVIESGVCGENAAYTLYEGGRLVITGTGEIWEACFQGRYELTSVEIGEGITAIGHRAFEDCGGITALSFPDTLASIGDGAFFGAVSLTGELVIPDSVTTINGSDDPNFGGLGAFGNTGYSSVVVGEGITAIPYGAFSGCAELVSVTMPDRITAIGSYAFSFCPRLSYIEIPAAVTEIGAMAFVNDFSLTRVVFRGSVPAMDAPFYCSSFNGVGFYPAEDESWSEQTDLVAMSELLCFIPYTTDAQGDLIPQLPLEDQEFSMLLLQDRYPQGASYPDSYNYIINGDFLTGCGSEAFAFQVSDALCSYLPMGEKKTVDAAALNVGDILYRNGECCTVTAVSGEMITVAGVENGEVYYDRTMTRDEAAAAEAVRARVGVAIGAGLADPALDQELTDLPTEIPEGAWVYDTILSLQEAYPEGMPYSSKNHFHSRTQSPVWYEGEMPVSLSMHGHGCSAFAYMVSDLCFGNLPARLLPVGQWYFEELKVGDSLIGMGHQVIILEVYEDHVVVVEGNYNETIHWGRTMTREECLESFQLYTRYPADHPFTDVPRGAFYTEPVVWAVENGITTGASENAFDPDGECMRAHVVTFLWRAAGCPEPTSAENPFVDVKDGDFFYKAVLWAVENNITNGVDAIHFGPTVYCNRAQVVTFLYRAMGSPDVGSSDCPFGDVVDGQWYEQAVLWAVENAVTNGMSADSFGTNGICNRAQVVTFLYRTYVN